MSGLGIGFTGETEDVNLHQMLKGGASEESGLALPSVCSCNLFTVLGNVELHYVNFNVIWKESVVDSAKRRDSPHTCELNGIKAAWAR
ncbi:hypothetical protein HGG76_02430 [Ochrobactrum tritici]|uniref:Uncharacterized protein n=1 Tax=Brucella tritici TaxID=94626 RepID=A0A7X6JBL0_9HYPH|nr:hypothetical protein [Brucella tritici]